METIRTIATLLPLALTSGINLYATLLVAGLSIRFGWVEGAPASLEALAAWPVIILAGVFYLIEFLADKIQFVDNLWDLVHTFIRPFGAALIGMAVIGKADPVLMVIAALVSGGIALASHGGKAGTRVAMNVLSPAENVSNVSLSLGEDILAGGLTFLALKYPYLASGIGIVLVVLMVIFIPQLLGWAWFTLTALLASIRGFGRKVLKLEPRSDVLPLAHAELLQHQQPEIVIQCKAQGIPHANGRSGYLSILDDRLSFTYSTWFGSRMWQLSLKQVVAVYMVRRVLMDVVQIHFTDERGKETRLQFVFKKDRSTLAEKVANRLGAKTAQ